MLRSYHIRPPALILICRFDRYTECSGRSQRPMRVANELAGKEDDVGLSFLQVRLRLLWLSNHAHGPDQQFGVSLFDSLGEVHL